MKIIQDDGIKAIYDIGITDAYGHKCYIGTFLNQFCGCITIDNRYYNKRKNRLEKLGLKHVIPQKYFDIIDLTEATICKIKKHFIVSDTWLQKWNIHN
ncbi:MAG TPA: hypothetical protein VIK86_07910 [Candidatus Paceibacterota bacterium]